MPENKGKLAFFGGIRNARFRQKIRPGDMLELRCELCRMHGPVGIGKAEARIDGKTAVSAELTFMIG